MTKMWKTALAITLVLGLWGAVAQSQPLIAGNTAAFGNGPINTWDFSGVPFSNQVGSFIPQGAIPSGPDIPNGRGFAIGGDNVYYTELSGADSYGPTSAIRRALFNAGAGGATDNGSLPNPRPGFGIQDLTIFNSRLYSLTGYPDQPPVVFVQNLAGGVVQGPINIPFPASTDSDGFAILPDTGNFLINRGDTSCIYDEYDKATGAFIGRTINVPGNAAICTGVDTDGTSLFFMTDFDSITKTDLFGSPIAFVNIEGTYDTEDISLVHPVTAITGTGDGHFFFALRNTDDINSNFDIRADLLKNGIPVATGLTRCYPITKRAIPGNNVPVPISLPSTVPLVSGDVLSVSIYVRMGTNPDDTRCPGHFSDDHGLRFFYDSTRTPSQFDMTIAPNPSATFYFHSDGTFCTDVLGESQPTLTLNRTLSDIPPAGASVRCKEVPTQITFAGGNPWNFFSTWSLLPLP